MKNNLVGLIVALAVGVLMVGTILAPFVSAVTEETRTYTNDGVPYSTDTEGTHTIVVSSDGEDFIITVDGEESEVPDLSLYGSATLVYCEDISLRLFSTGLIQGEGQNAAGTTAGYNLGTVDSDTSVTISISGSDVTSGSNSFDDLRAFICPDGDYVLCQTPCVDSTSTIMIIGGTTTVFSAVTAPVTGIGTVEDFTAKVVRGSVVIDSAVVNTSAVDGDLVHVDSIVLNATYNSNSYTLTYTYFLAPSTIVYDNPEYIGSMAAPILLATMTVLIVALFVVAARGINRD